MIWSLQSYGVGTLITLVLQIGKMRHREAKKLDQTYYPATKCSSQKLHFRPWLHRASLYLHACFLWKKDFIINVITAQDREWQIIESINKKTNNPYSCYLRANSGHQTLTFADLTETVSLLGSNLRQAWHGVHCCFVAAGIRRGSAGHVSQSCVIPPAVPRTRLHTRINVLSGKLYAPVVFSTGDLGTSLDLSVPWESQGQTGPENID